MLLPTKLHENINLFSFISYINIISKFLIKINKNFFLTSLEYYLTNVPHYRQDTRREAQASRGRSHAQGLKNIYKKIYYEQFQFSFLLIMYIL